MEQFFSFLGNHPILVGTFLLLLFLFFRNERTRAGATVGTQELVRLVNKENAIVLDVQIGRAHVRTPVTEKTRMPSSA